MRTLALMAAAACVTGAANAATPRTIPFQGRLTNAAGQPLPDGERAVTFRIYASASGGSALWTANQLVNLTGGRFATTLGGAPSFPSTMLFDVPYFVGVTVANDPEMSPRLPLQAVPYALSLSLPSRADASVNGPALSITNAGAGRAIEAMRTSAVGTAPAVAGSTASNDPYAAAILGEIITTAPGTSSAAVRGINNGTNDLGSGVYGSHAGSGWGVIGTSNAGTGVLGQSDSSRGVHGASPNGAGVYGQSSKGYAGIFAVTDTAGQSPAVFVSQAGSGPGLQVDHGLIGGGAGIAVNAMGSGVGIHAIAEVGNGIYSTTNSAFSAGVMAENLASGDGMSGWTTGSASSSGVLGFNQGTGAGVRGINNKNGPGGVFMTYSVANPGNALEASAAGSGNGLYVSYNGGGSSTATARNLAVFRTGNANKARIDNTGKGFFNGGTQSSGADVAEAFAVHGERDAYAPGDVLVISSHADRALEKSSTPYATTVAGVYSTRPGTLLTERDAEADHSDTVPLGVIGVIPTKVTAENGVIRRGDLLVTAGTPGHAMKAGPNPPAGSVIGKALAEFNGDGAGLIRVLVNVR